MGATPWTCCDMLDAAHVGTGRAAGRMRAALTALPAADSFELGMYLRGRVGVTANGLELRRAGRTKNKVARWVLILP
jgi:hypothetical protein